METHEAGPPTIETFYHPLKLSVLSTHNRSTRRMLLQKRPQCRFERFWLLDVGQMSCLWNRD